MPVRAYNVAQKQLHTRYVFGVYASSEGLQLAGGEANAVAVVYVGPPYYPSS